MRYAHAQISWLNIIILGTVALLCLTAASTIPGAPGFIPIGVGSLMLVLGFLFYGMSIEIDDDAISMSMGPGLIRKRWLLADAVSARARKTRIIDGWGIKLTTKGWLYSVGIPDAVHIEFADGKGVLLGTNDLDGLMEALREAGLEIKDD